MSQLLDGLERTSCHLALRVNMPPLDISGLRAEWEQFRANLDFRSRSCGTAPRLEQ
jgi:hypothetical protein